jgi:transcriptional regulator with XRE-family HTH domain
MQEIPFGQQVRERRRALDLTQEELARRVACAAITVRRIEAGTMRASQQIAERLAAALAVPQDQRAAFVRAARAVVADGREPVVTPRTPQLVLSEVGQVDLNGRMIRGYQLGEQLGSGGFGAVYRAMQPLVEREVAIKIILPNFADQPDWSTPILCRSTIIGVSRG